MKQKQLNPIKKSSQQRQQRHNHHLLDLRNEFIPSNKKSQPHHPMNELKPRINLIKINKAKLPPDFFPKCLSFQKKLPHFKLNIHQLNQQLPTPKPRRVESQRLHVSPQKTSFFGFFEPQSQPERNPESRTLAVKRKFQTRQQPKRDNSQMKRRFTPGSNLHRNDLLQLFPSTYDQHLAQIITSNSSARIHKLSPRKQYQTKLQQLNHDLAIQNQSFTHSNRKYYQNKLQQLNHDLATQNQSFTHSNRKYYQNKLQQLNHDLATQNQSFTHSHKYDLQVPSSRNLINLRTVEREEPNQPSFKSETVDLHNMTFFNAKSSCLPPIKKI